MIFLIALILGIIGGIALEYYAVPLLKSLASKLTKEK